MWLCGHQRDVEKTSHPFVLIVGKGKRKPHLFHSWRNPLTRLSTWKWKISNVSSNKLQQPPLTTHLCIDNFSFEELYHVMKRNSYAGCWNDRQLFVLPPQRCTPGWTQAAYSLKHSIAQKYLLYIPHHIPICWVVMDWHIHREYYNQLVHRQSRHVDIERTSVSKPWHSEIILGCRILPILVVCDSPQRSLHGCTVASYVGDVSFFPPCVDNPRQNHLVYFRWGLL